LAELAEIRTHHVSTYTEILTRNSNVASPPAARSRYQRPLAPSHERTKTSSPATTIQIITAILRVLPGPNSQLPHIAQFMQRVRIEICHAVISRAPRRPVIGTAPGQHLAGRTDRD
jgi:hypothetical protein